MSPSLDSKIDKIMANRPYSRLNTSILALGFLAVSCLKSQRKSRIEKLRYTQYYCTSRKRISQF